MLTNDDLELIEDVVRFLNGLATPRSTYLCNRLVNLHNKVVDNKNKMSENSKEYNKRNKERHRLLNAISYHKQRKNWGKVKELEIELENLKDRKISLF